MLQDQDIHPIEFTAYLTFLNLAKGFTFIILFNILNNSVIRYHYDSYFTDLEIEVQGN